MIGAALAGLWLWGAAAGAAAAPPSAPPSLEASFEKPALNGMRLSPSGRYLASIQRRGDGQAVVVLDRKTGQTRIVTHASTEHVGFDAIEWKGEDRLLLRTWLFEVLRANDKPDGAVLGYRYGRFIEAADRDGGHLVVAFQNNPAALQRSTGYLEILDLLADDPGHILIAAQDARGCLSAWKMDVATGEAELVEAGDYATVGWSVDGLGAVVGRTELRDGMTVLQARDASAAGGWRDVLSARQAGNGELADFEVLGPAEGAGQVYVAVRPQAAGPGDVRQLHIYDFNSRSLSPSKWPGLRYDLSGILYRPGGHRLAAACYIADVYTCDFADKTQDAEFRGVSRFFGDRRNLAPVSMSRDGRLWVLSVTGADQPGAYYLFDADARHVSLLGDRYPELTAAGLGPGERFDYAARDGTSIPSYLILPPGAAAGALPTVVMVHDGPARRDSLDYDALTQVLATRGYQVFKPNFRGSGGYGRGWAQAGLGQWDGRMAQDVTDGVRALVAAGRADPERICIIGGGYGGYAALHAGYSQPDLYRCIAAWAAPSDLEDELKNLRKRSPATWRDWSQSIGTEDRDRLKALSPVRHAAAFHAPVLLVHGEDDELVPAEQSKAMAAALEKAGKQATLTLLEGEGHADFGAAGSKRMMSAITDFLAASLGAPNR
jgi:dipeptidyl aminopeptidase/acylaminoacyl peptidase